MSIEKAFDPTLPDDPVADDRLEGEMPYPDPSVRRMATEYEEFDPDLYKAHEGGSDEESAYSADALREKADVIDRRVKAFVRRSPLSALAGAMVAGFIVGRIASRS